MVAERMHNCWEIMQCDDNGNCPVREKKTSSCWELMAETNEFQCQYGLCQECIVYLCNNGNTILSDGEIQDVLISRGLHKEDFIKIKVNEKWSYY